MTPQSPYFDTLSKVTRVLFIFLAGNGLILYELIAALENIYKCIYATKVLGR